MMNVSDFEFDHKVNKSGDLYIEYTSYSNFRWGGDIFINKDDAIKIIAHLKQVFDLGDTALTENKKTCIDPSMEAVDAFWDYWKENGETHRHGYYESTWGAINAALSVKTTKE